MSNNIDLTQDNPFTILDKDLNMPTSFGFVVDLEGNIHHLREPYTHGVVVACMEVEKVIEFGLPKPSRDGRGTPHLYRYQDFEIEVGNDLGYIRYGYSLYERLSFASEKINEAQVKALETWFKSNLKDDIENQYLHTDDELDASLVKVLAQMKKSAYNNRVQSNFKKDYTLVEPEEEL